MAMLNPKFQRNMRNMKKKTKLPLMDDWIYDGEGGKNRWIDKK
jgi:hypothetical protein